MVRRRRRRCEFVLSLLWPKMWQEEQRGAGTTGSVVLEHFMRHGGSVLGSTGDEETRRRVSTFFFPFFRVIADLLSSPFHSFLSSTYIAHDFRRIRIHRSSSSSSSDDLRRVFPSRLTFIIDVPSSYLRTPGASSKPTTRVISLYPRLPPPCECQPFTMIESCCLFLLILSSLSFRAAPGLDLCSTA